MAKPITLIAGDSSNLYKVTHGGVSDYTGYTGKVVVLGSTGAVLVSKQVMPDLAKGFTFSLAPNDTEGLAAGTYKLAFEITKTVGGAATFRRELQYDLVVKEARVP